MDDQATAKAARHMIRGALKGALATSDAASGAPYASMILLATTPEGEPYTLMSALARHTRNLGASDAASILVDTSNAAGDAASGGRVSVLGHLRPDTSVLHRRRFLARHPAARDYAEFADFAFYRFDIASAHLIEGFGRIVTLPRAAMLAPSDAAARVAAAESELVERLKTEWPAVCGVDCEGVDIVLNGTSMRLAFTSTVDDPVSASDAAAKCLADHEVK